MNTETVTKNTSRTVALNSAGDLTVELKKRIQQQDLDELIINYSLTSDGDVITDSPFAFLKSLREINFRITIGPECKSLEKLFFGCEELCVAPELNIEHVENLNWMFENCYALHTVPTYRIDSAATLVGMFRNCRSLVNIPPLAARKDAVLDRITQGCKGLTIVPHLKSSKIILDSPDDVTDVVRLRVAALDLSEIVINFSVYRKMLFGQFTETCSPFSGISSLTRIPFKITIGPGCRSLEGLFYGCSNLTALPEMDTGSVTDFNSICYECTALEEIPMLDTGKVTTFQNAFHGCVKLARFPEWNTASATNMFGMFEGCSSLKALPDFDTSSVTSLSWFVSGCEQLSDFPALDTGNVMEMSFMFNKCSSLVKIPRLNIKKVADPEKIFIGFGNQKIINGFFGFMGLRILRQRLLRVIGSLTRRSGKSRLTLKYKKKQGKSKI